MSSVSQVPEVIAFFPHQMMLEKIIAELIQHGGGIREDQLWLMTLAEMRNRGVRVALMLVAGTVRRMLDRGKLVGIDYSISGESFTFILPPDAMPTIVSSRLPVSGSASISVLHTES